MRRKQLVLILSLLYLSCLSGCGKDKVDPTEPSPLETIAPETKSDLISDKLDEPDDYTIQTIGTTEAVINSDGDIATVGITETLEDDTFIGVTPSGDLMVEERYAVRVGFGDEDHNKRSAALNGILFSYL